MGKDIRPGEPGFHVHCFICDSPLLTRESERAHSRDVVGVSTDRGYLCPDHDIRVLGRRDVDPEPIVPNATTIEAIRAARRGELEGPFATVDELMEDLRDVDTPDEEA